MVKELLRVHVVAGLLAVVDLILATLDAEPADWRAVSTAWQVLCLDCGNTRYAGAVAVLGASVSSERCRRLFASCAPHECK